MLMRVWLGGLLVVLGGLWLLDAADVLSADEVVDEWWPVALMALAGLAAAVERRVGLGPLVVFGVGAVLLVDQLEVVDLGEVVWPLLAVGVGVWLLLDLGRRHRPLPAEAETTGTFALFGGSQTKNRSQHFRHANVAAVLGGATLDLREAQVDPGAHVDALALFGGVDVLVPRGWRVDLGGLPVFGGYEDKTTSDGPLPPDAPVLSVTATAVFGGVDVKNDERG